MGRSVGHDWADFMATSGHFCWPSMGSSQWPLTEAKKWSPARFPERSKYRPVDVRLADCSLLCSSSNERHMMRWPVLARTK
jgi:hypothetical protein